MSKKYWDCFNRGDYGECGNLISSHLAKSLITTEMFDKALEVEDSDLCGTIIWYIKKDLITVEMFNKALKVKAYDVCEDMIRYIKKDLNCYRKMFKELLSMGRWLMMYVKR